MRKLDDLTGRTFGKLYVISRAHDYISPSQYLCTQYLCRCECDEEIIVRRTNLISGASTSCGCCNGKNTMKGIVRQSVGSCIHNREGVVCEDHKCSDCGWNPCNTKLKRQRLQKLKERMRGK